MKNGLQNILFLVLFLSVLGPEFVYSMENYLLADEPWGSEVSALQLPITITLKKECPEGFVVYEIEYAPEFKDFVYPGHPEQSSKVKNTVVWLHVTLKKTGKVWVLVYIDRNYQFIPVIPALCDLSGYNNQAQSVAQRLDDGWVYVKQGDFQNKSDKLYSPTLCKIIK